MDTGADITIVPASLLDETGAFPDEDGFLQDQWGGLHAIDFYTVKVIISGIHLPGIVVAGDQFSNELILGRNLLNKLTFLLDGPSLQTEVFESRPRIIRKS
jgi:predicted aspartyl protease